MASHMIDSVLFQDLFGTPKMREIFSDQSLIQNWLDFEAALAESQAELGMIPKECAVEIAKKAKIEHLDLKAVHDEINRTGHSLVALLRELIKKCDGHAGEYVHLGASSQDVFDTGFMLASKKAYHVITEDLIAIKDILLELIKKHKHTVMMGRTHGQHALPITFGYKVAVWASEVIRHIERLKESEPRIFVGQLSGPVGTLSGLGQKAIELQELVMKKLGLRVPEISWHVSRDRLVEMINLLAMMAGTFGKIANEIYQLQRTEIAELAEPHYQGKVGSSSMPHKRNPALAEQIMTLSKIVKSDVMLAHESLTQDHERNVGLWRVEWVCLPEAFIMTGAILEKSKTILEGLIVNEEKMMENLDLLKGLPLSEAVMMALSEKMGKQTAYELVYELSMKVHENGSSFKEELLNDSRVNTLFSEEEMEQLLDPCHHTGYSHYFSERVLNHHASQE